VWPIRFTPTPATIAQSLGTIAFRGGLGFTWLAPAALDFAGETTDPARGGAFSPPICQVCGSRQETKSAEAATTIPATPIDKPSRK
jgi:hypothetical protein